MVLDMKLSSIDPGGCCSSWFISQFTPNQIVSDRCICNGCIAYAHAPHAYATCLCTAIGINKKANSAAHSLLELNGVIHKLVIVLMWMMLANQDLTFRSTLDGIWAGHVQAYALTTCPITDRAETGAVLHTFCMTGSACNPRDPHLALIVYGKEKGMHAINLETVIAKPSNGITMASLLMASAMLSLIHAAEISLLSQKYADVQGLQRCTSNMQIAISLNSTGAVSTSWRQTLSILDTFSLKHATLGWGVMLYTRLMGHSRNTIGPVWVLFGDVLFWSNDISCNDHSKKE
eukprot:1156567-Pelagomonas_calceolata.AAC.2